MNAPKPITRRKALTIAGLGGIAATTALTGPALGQTPRQKRNYPRISKAIEEMQATKGLLENSPSKFGGYKVKAIAALEVAIIDLKLALQYADS